MALKPCRECGKEVSDEAEICPNCGIKNPTGNHRTTPKKAPPASVTKRKGNALSIGILTIIGIIIVFAVLGSNSGTSTSSSQTTTPEVSDATSSSESSPSPLPSISVQDFLKSSAETDTLSIPTEQSGNYDELCRDKWTQAGNLDQEEYAYCVNQEQQGYSSLVGLTQNYSNMPNAQVLLDSTISQWTKDGYRDDGEIEYVFGEQISDFKDFAWLASSQGFNEDEGQECISQWTSGDPQFQNWSEIDYCYKQFPDFKTPPTN